MSSEDFSQRPGPYPVPPATERIIVTAAPPRRSWLGTMGRVLFFLFLVLPGILVALLVVGTLASLTGSVETGVAEHYHSLSKTATDKIAIITVDGAIISGEGFIKKQIDHVRDDKSVKAVVLRVNSPGGTVSASDYLYHHL